MKRYNWFMLTTVNLVVGLVLATGFLAYASGDLQSATNDSSKNQTITIEWQKVIDKAGQTCDQCGATQAEVRNALDLLRKSLAPLGIDVVLEEKTPVKTAADKNICESNQLWIAGKSLEAWLGAKTGASDCSTSCGSLCGANVKCRTVIVGGNTYESIPSALIVQAGLLAAADIEGAKAVPPSSVRNNPPPKYGLESLGGSGCSGGSCKPGSCGK